MNGRTNHTATDGVLEFRNEVIGSDFFYDHVLKMTVTKMIEFGIAALQIQINVLC